MSYFVIENPLLGFGMIVLAILSGVACILIARAYVKNSARADDTRPAHKRDCA